MRALNDALYARQREIEEEMSLLGSERYRKQYDRALEKDRFDDTYPGTILIKMAIEKLTDAISSGRTKPSVVVQVVATVRLSTSQR